VFASIVLLSHFSALLLFALLASIALACVAQRSTTQRIKYAVWSVILFVVIGVGIAWLMYPFSR
jgi:hypothetical protein